MSPVAPGRTVDRAAQPGPPDAARRRPFRADLDGLRALAVVTIVAYHVGLPGFSGGFVGVDVFFVISGFLITRNLLDEQRATGRIALGAFWCRRVRRLAPALATMVVVTTLVSLVVLGPLEWRLVANDAAASSLSVSNVAFALRARDYFAVDASSSLFLHTWSLSVEQQFYVVWPLLAVALGAVARRRPRLSSRALLGTLLALGGSSLALSAWLTERGTPWAFYSLPTRVWQFALAGGLAVVAARIDARSRPGRDVLAWVGVGAIVVAVIRFDGHTPYPGTSALLPTLGAVAIVGAAATGSRVSPGRLLSVAPAQLVGRLSYSWYLWHWPALVLGGAAGVAGWAGRTLVAGAALGVAAASHRFVERPIRFHRRLVTSPGRTWAVGLSSIVAGLLVAALLVTAARHRDGDPFDAALAEAKDDDDYWAGCRRVDGSADTCTWGDEGASSTIVVVGDSHARMWTPAIVAAVRHRDVRVVGRSRGGCPSVDVAIAATGTGAASPACARFRVGTDELVGEIEPDVVVIANAAYPGRILDRGAVPDDARQASLWSAALADHVSPWTTRRIPVLLIRSGPQLSYDPIVCLSRHRDVARCTPTRTDAMSAVELFRRAEDAALERVRGPVAEFDPAEAMCPDRSCPLRAGGTYRLLDGDHVTHRYSSSVAPAVAAALDPALARGGGG